MVDKTISELTNDMTAALVDASSAEIGVEQGGVSYRMGLDQLALSIPSLFVTAAASASGDTVIDLDDGFSQLVSCAGDVTIRFANWPSIGDRHLDFYLWLSGSAGYTVDGGDDSPSGTRFWVWPGNADYELTGGLGLVVIRRYLSYCLCDVVGGLQPVYETSYQSNLSSTGLSWSTMKDRTIKLTLANLDINAFSGADGGDVLTLTIEQDSTGGRTMTWTGDTDVVWIGGTAPQPNSAADSISMFRWKYNSSLDKYIEIMRHNT